MTAPGKLLAPGFVALGYAGLLPFVAGALGIALLEGAPREFAVRALVAYGAVILSFLGAVHWGLLLTRDPDGRTVPWLAAGVMPALTAWGALLLADGRALTALVVGFGAFWLYEHRVVGMALLPAGYLQLRRSLSLAACALLALAVIALG